MIDNPKAGQIRAAAALMRKKERLEKRKFLVEGPHAVEEALKFLPQQVVTVYITLAARTQNPQIDIYADAADVHIEVVTENVIASLADTVNPQGVTAVVKITETDFEQAVTSAKLLAIVHNIQDPGNAGTVLRAADAAGADAVIFSGDCIDPWHPKVVRATTGSLFHLPVFREKSLSQVLDKVHSVGIKSFAADLSGEHLKPSDKILRTPVCWVFGNEARGLEPEEAAMCSRAMKLPIFGNAESLNLATAAAICLYTTAFAQRQADTW